MTFKDLENWQKEYVVDNLKENESPYIEYNLTEILEGFKKENIELKKQNEFLMQRDNKCQMLEQAVKKAIALLTDDNVVADIRRLKPKYNENKYGVERELLDVLKEVE